MSPKWLLIGSAIMSASAKVTLRYFPVAARGELTRLYAAAGGLEMVDSVDVTGYQNNTLFGFLPALDHPEAGILGLQESLAIERYVANIAPKFSGLTPAQRAMDDMFACAKEDIMVVESCLDNASIARACVPPRMERYLSRLELLVPTAGFVHGLGFPTGADLATLIIAKAGFPWGRAMLLAGYTDWPTRFPKVHALAERTACVPDVARYLATSQTFLAKLQPDPPPSTAVVAKLQSDHPNPSVGAAATARAALSATVPGRAAHASRDESALAGDAPTSVPEAAVTCGFLAAGVAMAAATWRARGWSRRRSSTWSPEARPYAAYPLLPTQ